MKMIAVGGLALLLLLAGQAHAGEKLLLSKSGMTIGADELSGALPGAGTYRLEVSTSEEADLWIDAKYETHWDVFLAPPPRPHEEFIDGNEGSDVYDQYNVYGKFLSAVFVVPETKYTFFTNNGSYNFYGVPLGAALYREDRAELPWFSLSAVRDFDPTPFRFTANLYQTGVPEPSTWALMIGGFGMAGATIRRRYRSLSPS